ncbi:MAG: hypothetical protein Q8M02_01930 [Candidatus Didemnitutus sp.]|nr:hypothetical protein [Candidatus Didemnitutus sp.]
MAHSFRNLTTALLAFSCWLVLAAAERVANVEFNVFALHPIEGLTYTPAARQGKKELQFFATSRSENYSYRGKPRLEFFDRDDPSKQPVAVWEIPEEMKRATLIFSPKERNEDKVTKYSIIAVDDSMTRIPAGHFAVLNLSSTEYVGIQGKEKMKVAPGLNPAVVGKRKVYIGFALPGAEKNLLSGYQFENAPNQRVLLIIFPPAKKTSLQPVVRRLVEDGVAKAETETP